MRISLNRSPTCFLSMAILHLMIGTPFAWKKFREPSRLPSQGMSWIMVPSWWECWCAGDMDCGVYREIGRVLSRLSFVSSSWRKPRLASPPARQRRRWSVGRLLDTVIFTLDLEETFTKMEYRAGPDPEARFEGFLRL